MNDLINSVLFCCDYNSVRSPMAEGIFKKLFGKKVFVQSAGIYDSLEIDGFTIRVCSEIKVELTRHQVKSLIDLEKQGGFVGSFDLVIALTSSSLKIIKGYAKFSSVGIEFWNIVEPFKDERAVEATLKSYRETRDIIYSRVNERFGNQIR